MGAGNLLSREHCRGTPSESPSSQESQGANGEECASKEELCFVLSEQLQDCGATGWEEHTGPGASWGQGCTEPGPGVFGKESERVLDLEQLVGFRFSVGARRSKGSFELKGSSSAAPPRSPLHPM